MSPNGDAMTPPPFWTDRILKPLARAADVVLDPSIVLSFDHTGFVRHRTQFIDADTEVDMTDRVCVVTGGNSGLGLATTRALLNLGATVWILSRNEDRSKAVVSTLRRETGNPNIHHAHLDLADPTSVESLSERFTSPRVDVLVNNAGVLLNERRVSPAGLEGTLATNLVGHIKLTAALLPRLKKGTRSRVIWVTSGGMYAKKLNVDQLYSPPDPFDGVSAYAQTKRAMATISTRMADALRVHGIAVHCMHPGWADTPGVEQSLPRFWQITKPFLRTPEAGADTIVWLSVCDRPTIQSGLFWFDRKARSLHLLPHTRHHEDEADRLWTHVHAWANLNPETWTR